MRSLWYIDYAESDPQNDVFVWKQTEDTTTIKLNECLQELLLWRGESQFFADNGVDYDGMFRGSADISAQVISICDSYKDYFADIVVEATEEDDNMLFKIQFVPEYLSSNTQNLTYNFSYSRYENTEGGKIAII